MFHIAQRDSSAGAPSTVAAAEKNIIQQQVP